MFSGKSRPVVDGVVRPELRVVQLDQGAVEQFSSYAAKEVFQSVLYSVTGLTATEEHTIVRYRDSTLPQIKGSPWDCSLIRVENNEQTECDFPAAKRDFWP